MTIINVNSISGINSITAQGASGIEFYDSSGNSVQTVTGDGLTVGTGATISGSTNTITALTNGSERLRILSSGNVGIGTDATASKLQVNGTVRSDEGYTVYPPSDSNYAFATRNAADDQWTAFIEANGQATFAGNVVLSTSGSGIDFSADSNATGMTSELLDDYEEGTWTPTIRENGTGTAWDTISSQVGTYTKVGQLVTVTFSFQYSARATNVTTSFYGFIAGLPFSNTSTSTNQGASTLMITQPGGSTTPYHIYLNVSQGNVLAVYGNQDSTTPGPLMTSEWPNVSATVRGQLFYYVP